jgi:hypothetical protein
MKRHGKTCALAGAALMSAALAVAGAPARAQDPELGPLVRITSTSPLAGCTADRTGRQPGDVYRHTEIEPWVEVNPANPDNLIAGWQQDRWSNGGSRSDYGAYSLDGGATWSGTAAFGTTLCLGGRYIRASDPWIAISPDGTAYFMQLVFEADTPAGGFGRNAMLVSRSSNGGRTWGKPTELIVDTDPQVLNDKNSMTADPTDSRYAYAVWDRLQDFTIPVDGARARPAGMDGVAMARERVRQLRAAADAPAARAAEVFFKGPSYFARTTDGGRNWEAARVVYDPGDNAQTINNLVAVLPNGTLIDFFTDISPRGRLKIGYLRSHDQGETFNATPDYVSTILSSGTVTPNDENPVRDGSILFDVAVDQASGAVYAVWQDTRFTGVEGVAFSQSTDNGRNWSRPIRVDRTPENNNPLRRQAFTPSVAVAGDGTIVVTYYDFRFDNNQGELTDYWAVICRPADPSGCSQRSAWRTELRLTKSSFDMRDAPVAGGHFLGDYMALTAIGQDVWPIFGIAGRPDRTDLFVRKITLP